MSWFKANPFPDSAWSVEALGQLQQKPATLPKDWASRFSLPSPNPKKIEAECCDVLKATKDRPTNLADIESEATGVYGAINKVQQVVGKLLPQMFPPATARLLHTTLTDAVPVTFALKQKFNRGRPYHCCDLPLAPLFQPPSPLYPGHPSYPSGHSTQAHLVAELYARMFPRLRPSLIQAAQGVARRREIAGLHFASDSAAGALLAVQLADEFLRVPELVALFNQAKAEWPSLASAP